MKRKRVGVLISGRGSNMMALAEAAREPDCPYEITCVVSNKADAAGLAWARAQGIATHVISHRDFPSREAFDMALNDCLQGQNLDFIACAGFMRVMTAAVLRPWAGRVINIHPSLLPKYKGLHTHERALAAGDTEAGCTVHLVTEELDGGPILAQSRVSILPGDTPETLAARILEQEHRLYPATLKALASK